MAIIQHIAIIHFDFGASGNLASILAELGIKRPLYMTDQGVRACGMFDQATRSVRAECVYDRTPENPTIASVREALELFRAGGCDGIVAVGGGSPIDCAKGVALLASHEGPIERYRVGPAALPITASIVPLIAVPTTAGTSSEIGRGAGITLDSGEKAVFYGRNLVPKVAIFDPELTFTLPARLTAATGIDAFSHCLEAFLSPAVNPPGDVLALSGLRRLAAFIQRATESPQDREARWNMMMGVVEAGMAMWKGLGHAHALGVPLDGPGLHHGTLVGVLLPETIRWIEPDMGAKGQAIRDALGLPFGTGIADHLKALNARIGLPGTLAEMGVPESAFAEAARWAAGSVFNASSLKSASEADFRAILDRC